MKIKPLPSCPSCHGTGEALDFVPVPFGIGNCAMPSLCSRVEEQISENYDGDVEIDLQPIDTNRDDLLFDWQKEMLEWGKDKKGFLDIMKTDISTRQKEIESWYDEPVEARFVVAKNWRGWQVWLNGELIDEWDGE